VLFWLKTLVRYLVVTVGATLLSFVASVLATLPFASKEDDLGIGFLWFLIFLPLAGVLTSFSLGVTAELVQRSVSIGRFEWSKAVLRSVLALPIAVGPAYAAIITATRRPAHGAEKEVLLYAVSACFGFFALRIRKRSLA
jgi:hypothetical protein